MNERIKTELEKIFHTSKNNFKFVLGDARLNIHVNKKFLFPYNQLDLVRNVLTDTVKDFAIYFVMSCGRKEIKSFKVNKGYIDIKYSDIDSGEMRKVTLDMNENIGINPPFIQVLLPFFKYEISKSGSAFRMYISDENMMRLKAKYPDVFLMLPEVYRKNNLFYLEFDIYNLIWENKQNHEKTEKYDLLYIGKSNATRSDFDILKRLNSHETIQRITRENNLYYRSKELLLMIFSFSSKLYQQHDLNQHNASILLGNSAWEQAKLLTNIKENQEVILLIEAILINHFKPKYNQQYIDQISIDSKIYHEFKKQNVNPISVELDLNMGWGKIGLKTREQIAETKMRVLECYQKDNAIHIEYKDISDYLYDIF